MGGTELRLCEIFLGRGRAVEYVTSHLIGLDMLSTTCSRVESVRSSLSNEQLFKRHDACQN